MTQQDGTGQGPGVPGACGPRASAPEPGSAAAAVAEPAEAARPAEREEPVRPSPYLPAGEAVPEAYLAPPQPGQPRYGDPPLFRPGYQRQYPTGDGQPGSGQPGSGRPGSGHPGSGQGRYGQRRPARPGQRRYGGSAARAAREPGAAAPWQRLTAACLDWLLILVVATAIFFEPLLHVWRQMQVIAANFTDPNSPAAQAALNAVATRPGSERTLLYWFLVIFGLALAYFWVQHAAFGATVGKRLLGTRVVSAADHSSISVRAAGIRALAAVIGPMLFLLLANPANLIGGVFWLADMTVPLIDRRAQSLHDKVAGTMVVQERWLAEQRKASPW